MAEEGRGARSAAWGVVFVVFGGGAFLLWLAVPTSPVIVLIGAWIVSVLGAAGLYMCFASLSGAWPAGRTLRGHSRAPQPSAVIDLDGALVGAVSTAHYYTAAPAMRSGWREYLEQVREIAPRDGLIGRDGDLAKMEAFSQGSQPYWWWEAGPWAGKSALMSWFVINPPPGTAVVAFFATARYAAQDDSAAFTGAVLRQLEELLGQDLPPSLAAGELYSSYRLLLRQAAHHFERRGQRLILAVDGLDEDRSPDRGLPSIASMLPKHCDHGLKVIVASRPHPQIPPDVAADHPLRDPGAAHTLIRSPHAQVIRDTAQQELHSLLTGPSGQHDLLGLLTAASGGLALADLAELTGQPPYQIRRTLRGVTGRTFTTRPVNWPSPTDDDAGLVYLLAHETLQAEATAAIGPQRLAAYRDQLRAWADTYRARSWPPDTPAYLLQGYFRMLQATSNIARITSLATDPARHHRLLARSGGDTAALTEIAAAINLVLTQPVPDLTAMTLLAYHRDTLTTRNRHIPAHLPAVWAQLGNPTRADALACSISDPDEQAQALAEVAQALAEVGLHDQAESTARAITDPGWQAQALAEVARALAAAGLHDQAEQAAAQAESTACAIASSYWQPRVLAKVAQARAAAGLYDQAESTARAITDPDWQARALAEVARALAAAGLDDQAVQAAAEAESTARTITSLYGQARALAEVARALAAAGLDDQAVQPATEAESVARAITDSDRRARALADVAGALAAAGLHDQAGSAIRAISDPVWQARALAEVTRALAAIGLYDQAIKAAIQTESAAHAITNRSDQAPALASAARALAAARVYDQAGSAARAISDPVWQARALADVARALAAAGLHDQAIQAATEAESTAWSIASIYGKPQALAEVVRGYSKWILAVDPLYEQAGSVAARAITEPDGDARALAEVAGALAAVGLHDQAVQAATRAENAACTITILHGQPRALAEVARALAAAGLYEQAGSAAHAITDPGWQARALADVARALASIELYDQAAKAATEAESTALAISNHRDQARALASTAQAMTDAGLHDRAVQAASRAVQAATQAESAARAVTNPDQQAQVLAEVAEALVATAQALIDADQSARAQPLVAQALSIAPWGVPVPANVLPPQALLEVASLLVHGQGADSFG